MCALSSRVEDWHGGGWRHNRSDIASGADRGHWSGLLGCDGSDTCVACGDRGGDIGVASGSCVSSLACSALNDGDRGNWNLLVLALIAFLAGIANASVDRADGARVALAVVAGGDRGSPGGHFGDSGLGGSSNADGVLADSGVGVASLAVGISAAPNHDRGVLDANVVSAAAVSGSTIGISHATILGGSRRWGGHASEGGGGEREDSESGVE